LLEKIFSSKKQQIENKENNLEKKIASNKQLTEEEENNLEKKIVWILGSPRSGTTWLARRLLRNKSNEYWDEPLIGWHLDIHRDWHTSRDDYVFSKQHKNNWLPAFRKLFLARAYSQAQTLTKNLIIKEPNGSKSADIIMEMLPNSKLIHLLRDGRDVVDSLIDAHKPDSWQKDLKRFPLLTDQQRQNTIKKYSKDWCETLNLIKNEYENHNPELRLLVRYEDLLNDTFTELKKIYQFLGISIEDDELRKIVKQFEFKNIPSSEKGPGKFNRSASPGKWKENLSKDEIKIMNSIMGEQLSKLNY